MRVCLICPNAAPLFFPQLEATYGGSEVQAYWIAGELACREGVDVHCIVHAATAPHETTVDGITVHALPLGRGLRARIALQRLLRRLDADAYLQRARGSITKELALFARRRHKPFLYWVASDGDVDRSVNQSLSRRLFAWGMRQADRVIVQTEQQRKQLYASYGKDSVRIPSSLPPRPEPQNEGRNLLWLGRLSPIKQPQLFLDLARALPAENFLLVGSRGTPESERLYNELQPAIEQTPNLTYLPGVPLDETDALFAQARLLVNTSATEGYPVTFMQAMWSHVPLASLAVDPDDMITQHALGVAAGGDWDRFVLGIQHLLANDHAREQAGRRARQYAEQHHNLQRNTDTLLDVLHEFVP